MSASRASEVSNVLNLSLVMSLWYRRINLILLILEFF